MPSWREHGYNGFPSLVIADEFLCGHRNLLGTVQLLDITQLLVCELVACASVLSFGLLLSAASGVKL